MPERAVGQILQRRRLALGLTQEQVAERASAEDEYLTQADISRIETGSVRLPRPARLRCIAVALDLSLGSLLLYASGVDDEGRVLVDAPHDGSARAQPTGPAPPADWDDPRRYRRVLDAVQQAMIITDVTGTIRYWNTYAEQLYGWTAEEVLGRDIFDITFADTPTWHAKATAIITYLSSVRYWSAEAPAQRKDGTPFSAHVTLSAVLDERGKVVAILATAHECTAGLPRSSS